MAMQKSFSCFTRRTVAVGRTSDRNWRKCFQSEARWSCSVSTLVFADPTDRPHIAALAAASASGGATISYVRLHPSREALDARVLAASRAASRKIRDLALLDELMTRHQLTRPINDDDLTIDNTELAPDVVADRIAAHLDLPIVIDAEVPT